ncbi:MAG: N-acetyltransferase [Proteobacteria bacterium]|nr:N-acetyltransferase [Pseudomonadota bacterium]
MQLPAEKWKRPVQIKTKRFALKPLLPIHATRKYLTWLRDDASSRYISTAKKTRSIKDLRNYIKIFSGFEDCIFLRILTLETNRHIGNIKYHPIDLEKQTAVMGILIGEPAWRGKGVAKEVIKATSHWLGENLGIKKIFLGVAKDNKSACFAYKKCGFQKTIKFPPKKRPLKNQVFMVLKTDEI